MRSYFFFVDNASYFKKMLAIPLKYTQPVDLVTPIRNYLLTKYPKVCKFIIIFEFYYIYVGTEQI